MTIEKKSDIIGKIISITKSDPNAYFDKLDDKSEQYLLKLLRVCKKLSKNAL